MSSTVIIPGTTYAYAYGRIGTLQNLLLTEADRNRLLGADNGQDAASILTELNLSSLVDQGIKHAPALLAAIEQWLEREAYGMTPEHKRGALAILWMDSIAAKLSLALKQKQHLNVQPDPLKDVLGETEEYAAWQEFIEKGQTSTLPAIAVQLLQRLPRIPTSAREIDQVVHTAAADFSVAAAKRSGSKAIVEYVQNNIDCKNVLNYLRFTKQFAEYFVPGGNIALSRFSSVESLATAIDSISLSYRLSAALRNDARDEVEAICSDIRRNDLAHMWNTPLTIEPVFAFAATALNHINYVRNVIIGKYNDIDPQHIKQMLPAFMPASAFA